MQNGTSEQLEPQHPPLARDALGNPVAIPDGTAAWRVCRKTTGRPREIVGPDNRPLRFPLDTTCERLVEMCGRDVYRVYALDHVGEDLDHVTTLDLTGDEPARRNAAPNEPSIAIARSTSAPTTDLRFALDAMTQMMRTNADALRVLTASHVDLAKSIAVAKGLPRNAALPMASAANDEQRDDDDDDDAEPEPARPKTIYDVLQPIAEQLSPVIGGVVAGRLTGQRPAPDGAGLPSGDVPEGMTAEEMELAQCPDWELMDLVNLPRVARKRDAKAKLRRLQQQPPGAAPHAAIPPAVMARVMGDTALQQKLFAIKAQLQPAELEVLMNVLSRANERDLAAFLDHLKVEPEAVCLQCVRELLAEHGGNQATQNP